MNCINCKFCHKLYDYEKGIKEERSVCVFFPLIEDDYEAWAITVEEGEYCENFIER